MTTNRRPLLAGAAGLALAAAFLATPAYADPAGGDELALSWTGDYGAAVTSFVGTPVTVPGDTAERTLTVRNDGPTDGTLRVSIVNVEILHPDAPDVHHSGGGDQGNFYDDLTLSWAVGPDAGAESFTNLYAGQDVVVAERPLAQGQSTEVTVGYDFPLSATSGNRANVAGREASFDVMLEIGGALPDLPSPPAAPPAQAAPIPSKRPTLEATGAAVGWLIASGAALIGLGIGVRRAGHRRPQ